MYRNSPHSGNSGKSKKITDAQVMVNLKILSIIGVFLAQSKIFKFYYFLANPGRILPALTFNDCE